MRMRRRREAPQLGLLAAASSPAARSLVRRRAAPAAAAPRAATRAACRGSGLLGARPRAAARGQRVIVVLEQPVARRPGRARPAARDRGAGARWTAAALAAQQPCSSRGSRSDGVRVQPEHSYARVFNGFSAALDPRAVALLERAPEVAGRLSGPRRVPGRGLVDADRRARPRAGSGGRRTSACPASTGAA